MGITANELLIPKKILKAETEKELEFDSSLPEYCPDIKRIVKVDCTPFSEACEITENKIAITGKAVCDILYETDYKSRLRCCSFTKDFSIGLPIPKSEAVNPAGDCDISCDKIDVKLLSPRRLIIKALLRAGIEAEGEVSVNAVAVGEGSDTFFREKTLTFEGRKSTLQGEYRFGEAFALNQAEKSIGEIVCGSITLAEPQISLSQGHAEIKTSATVKALCEEEENEGSYYTAVKTVPISIDYENSAISDSSHAKARLTPFDTEFQTELDQYGENRVIKAAFSVGMKLTLSEESEITVAEDLFEKEFESTPLTATVSLPRQYLKTDKSFSAEGKLDSAEIKPEVILDSSVKNLFCSAEAAEGGIVLKGSFAVTLLYKGENGINSCDRVLPYEQFLSAETVPDCEIHSRVYPIELLTSLYADGTVSARVIAGAQLSVTAEEDADFISEITKRVELSEKPLAADSLTYFFPEKSESLWSIAKHYRVSPEKVAAANPGRFIENGELKEQGKPILIKA